MKGILTLCGLAMSMAVCAFLASSVSGYLLEIQCTGRLKRAADANTVEMAREELGAAIAYAKTRGYTDGSTAFFFHGPQEDVGFWFRNLVAAENELASLPDNASAMERTNVLMKLRETLLDSVEGKTVVTQPKLLYLHPHTLIYSFLIMTCYVLGLAGLVVALALIKSW